MYKGPANASWGSWDGDGAWDGNAWKGADWGGGKGGGGKGKGKGKKYANAAICQRRKKYANANAAKANVCALVARICVPASGERISVCRVQILAFFCLPEVSNCTNT